MTTKTYYDFERSADRKIIQPVVFEEKRDFGLTDEKNRQVGINLSVRRVNMVPSTYQGGYDLPRSGEWFLCYAMATRNGEDFGASIGAHFEPTLDDAMKWVQKRAAGLFNSARHLTPDMTAIIYLPSKREIE